METLGQVLNKQEADQVLRERGANPLIPICSIQEQLML